MTPPQPATISIVACFYNEELVVNGFFAELIPILDFQPDIRFEIVCVDDGSQDRTLEQLLGHCQTDQRIRVIELTRNFGKEAALTAGIDAAIGDALIPIDADLQDPPQLIPALIEQWRLGAEVVLARRRDRISDGFLKRHTAALFYRLHNALSPIHLPEDVGDYRLIDRVVIEALKQFPERQRFMKGLFAWVGFKTSVVDFSRQSRFAGNSKFSGWKLWNFALEGVTSFTSLPLRIWTYVGLTGALLSLCYVVFIVSRTLMLGIDVPGYASLLVVILFMGSMQLLSIGLLGEYIGRIYTESKRRPIYLVRRRYGQDTQTL